MKDIVVNKSVGLPKSLIAEVSDKAKSEDRSFSNMLSLLVKRQIESEKLAKQV